MADILLVEDEANARRVLVMGLESRGHNVVACPGLADAREALRDNTFDVVLTDLRMDGSDAGLEVVKISGEMQPNASVILLTAYASAETAVEAMRNGAFDYLTKPVSGEELGMAIERALAHASGEHAASPELSETIAPAGLLTGSSTVMQRLRERLLRAARRDFTILISGESGTGKEVAARFVHQASDRAGGPFVPVHCGAIPSELFESELFGHRKGAFTGAESDRPGLIESAHGGTLFLDEIGEMPLSIQVKLLRVLQDMRIRRVGEEKERQVDVRVIAASNRDLDEEVRQGRFREDLFYRLNVVPVYMPPLRQRREDIPDLVGVLLARHTEAEEVTVTEECMARLSELPLPGNVRELENLLQRLVALSEDGTLDVRLLDELYASQQKSSEVSLQSLEQQGVSLDHWLSECEKKLISEALQRESGNVTKAAKRLGITFRSLRYRLQKLGMKEGDE